MLEARLTQGVVLKKVLDAIKDLVQDCNFDCSNSAISLQAMDSSHVALVSLLLKSEGFDHYRADRNVSLGINLASLGKIFKCMDANDSLTLKAEDQAEAIEFVFENEKQDRMSDFEMKLMDIDSEHLAVPETEYCCSVSMPSSEFQRVSRDLGALGDTVTLSASKDGLKFTVEGDIGKGSVTCRQSSGLDEKKEEIATTIECADPVELQFAMNYFSMFAKSSCLSKQVNLHMAPDVPIMVEYPIDGLGHLRFYLAPKIEEE